MSSMIYGVVSYLSTSYASGSARYHPDSKASRRLACAKSSMLQENNPDAACMSVHTSFGMCSDLHLLGLLLCVGLIADCAVLCCAVHCSRYYPPATLDDEE